MRISILKTGFATVLAEVPEDSTVGFALQQAEVNANGFNIIVDGAAATENTLLHAGTRAISLIGKVKGGADITVKVVKFGQQTVPATIAAGSTVRDALDAINYGLDGYSISLNGSPATLDSAVSDNDIIQLVPKVKGGAIGRIDHFLRSVVVRVRSLFA